MNQELFAELKEKFQKQMKRGGYGTLNSKDAAKYAAKYGITMAEVDVVAKRFGVLIDDPYAEKVTNWTRKGNSPHGHCFNPGTGQWYCMANQGETEDPMPWAEAPRPNVMVEDEENEFLL